MAHFFIPDHPDKAHVSAAVEGGALSELAIRPGSAAAFGLWGGGPTGQPLVVKVYRGGVSVSDGARPAVKVERVANDPANHVQTFRATGLTAGDQIVGLLPDGVTRYTAPLPVRVLGSSASAVMTQWAAALARGETFTGRGLFTAGATPYTAISDPKMGTMKLLTDAAVGGPLNDVNGLAVHTTAGTDARTPFQMARWGCVETWNGKQVSAHFGVAGNGTLVQFVPATFVANAQRDPGNRHWISVEVDNNGKAAMNALQVVAVARLFRWVCTEYGVSPKLATGTLFPKTPQFDTITADVCARGGASTTSDPFEACMSEGVSCHWWLEGAKSNRSHACPGPGMLAQLADVVALSGFIPVFDWFRLAR